MTDNEEAQIRELLKQSLKPVQTDLEHDLWPQMLSRMKTPPVTVPWFDWALLAALVLGLCLMPSAIPVILYHL
jgi:hypothetical protein